MASAEMKYVEKTIATKMPDRILLDLSIEEAIMLMALTGKLYYGNNYSQGIYESLNKFIKNGSIDYSKMFASTNPTSWHYDAMEHINELARDIRNQRIS